jgi:hypothetical protein
MLIIYLLFLLLIFSVTQVFRLTLRGAYWDGFVLRTRPHPMSFTICLAVACYAILVTGTAIACAIWLPAFTVPPSTEGYRPMGQALYSGVIGGGTTLLGLAFAVATVLSNPRRPLAWVLAVALGVLSLAPGPVSTRFMHWVIKTQGLTLGS